MVRTKRGPFIDFAQLKDTTTQDHDLLYFKMMNGGKKMTLKDAAKSR